jgi:hypothetical protein
MFKENISHNQPDLFAVKNILPENLKKIYEKSWAKNFYENVFCKIDEKIFEVLFSEVYSRPNTPVNIYVSLEVLKENFGLNDECLLERFHFDNMFMFAMGLSSIGEKTISERAFYNMRSRVVEYEERTGINLIFEVFKNIQDDYIDNLEISKEIKRIDSTLIGSNIKRLNRIRLFLETLRVFLNSLDKKNLKRLKNKVIEYKDIDVDNFVYKLSNEEAKTKIQEAAEHLFKVRNTFKDNSAVNETKEYKNIVRVINEHLNTDNKVEIKENKDISSGSMQSPHDPDATYRSKGEQANQGYSVTLAETCSKENKIQIITDVIVEENNKDDSKIFEENLESIMDKDTSTAVVDGAYLSDKIKEKTENNNKEIVATAIRGRKPEKDKISLLDFKIKNDKLISCPNGKKPSSQESGANNITAKFSHKVCNGCRLNCIIRKNKRKDNVLLLDKNKIETEKQRLKFKTEEYIEKCRLRPAIECAMFLLKLHLRNGKSKFRGKIKIKNRSILRAISINFNRLYSYQMKELLFKINFLFELILNKKNLLNFNIFC